MLIYCIGIDILLYIKLLHEYRKTYSEYFRCTKVIKITVENNYNNNNVMYNNSSRYK